MMILVFTRSQAFRTHLEQAVGQTVRFQQDLVAAAGANDSSVMLIHGSGYPEGDIFEFVHNNSKFTGRIAIADDEPSIDRMMAFSQIKLAGYCNTYMASPHYRQMFELLSDGMSWFPPHLLSDVFLLARRQHEDGGDGRLLALLTPRERDVAQHIASGKTNKEAAVACGITERTVKAHLTSVYDKLELKDRVALVLLLQNSDGRTVS